LGYIYVLDIYKKKYLSTAVASESETYQILDILGEIFLDQNKTDELCSMLYE
jgi:hypothetical protein